MRRIGVEVGVMSDGHLTGECYRCPFAHGSDQSDRCAADPQQREPTYFKPAPDWCPLREGPVKVEMNSVSPSPDPRDARIAALEKAEAESVRWARLVSDGIDQLRAALDEALDLADIWIGSDGPFDRDYKADRATSARLRDLGRMAKARVPQ